MILNITLSFRSGSLTDFSLLQSVQLLILDALCAKVLPKGVLIFIYRRNTSLEFVTGLDLEEIALGQIFRADIMQISQSQTKSWQPKVHICT